MTHRSVESLVPGSATQDGNRVPLTRLIPGTGQRGMDAFRAMDPFLLMDHFGPCSSPRAPTPASRPTPTGVSRP